MKVAILVFSPSGNTAVVANRLQCKLEQHEVTVQMVSVTKNPRLFKEKSHTQFLREALGEHDVLCIGGPVYANHLQYHVIDLLSALPKPGNGWGQYALPFVTYGGICSGIALEEAGELLNYSGRTVLAGMKVAASHNMTGAFMDCPINHDLPGEDLNGVLDDAVERILAARTQTHCDNHVQSLKYQPRELANKINTVFIEKEWHATRYPKVMVDYDACTQCGTCTEICPVKHLESDLSGNVVQNKTSECIHCFNCVTDCPSKAIGLSGNPEEARIFMSNIMKHGNEVPGSAVYPLRNS